MLHHPLDRRSLIRTGIAGMAATTVMPRMAFAGASTDQRFVFIIQRGAADGLHIVPPLGDPGYAALRGAMLPALADAPRLDGLFALHPAMKRIGALYAQRQALAVQAVASVYRDRSHFDGQNVLESGGTQPYAEKTGWMNRLIGALPDADRRALAFAPDVPMALRGPQRVSSYAPARLPPANADLLQRVSAMYADDALLHPLWESALATHAIVGDGAVDAAVQGAAMSGRAAAALLTAPGGARLMMIETLGWDTHTAMAGRLNTQLGALDTLVGALVDGLGTAWPDTLVLVATEFGRTAAVNGTQGTDHGTASAALLLGGSLRGGRVVTDWPGLAPGQLYQQRDLRPTRSLEGVVTASLAQHFAIDPARLARALYPDQPALKLSTV